jgi:K+ transporter
MIPSPIPVLGILSAIAFPIFVMVTISCAWSAFTSDDGDGGVVAVIAAIVAVVTAPNALMTYAALIGVSG